MDPYRWSERIEPRLQQATERMRRLRGARIPPSALKRLRHAFRSDHTYHSNAMGGNRLTLPETHAVLKDGIVIAGKPLKDHLEAVNLAHALDLIETRAREDTAPGDQDVRELHGIVLRGIAPQDAGVYRRINVRTGSTPHVPPEATHVPEAMRTFSEWLAGVRTGHPVVVSSIAHARFAAIHPFTDGNGRTGRLLANLLLMREHYPPIALRVEDRARYHAALRSSHSSDITALVELTLDGVERRFDEYERAAGEGLEPDMGASRAETSTRFSRWYEAVRALHEALREIAARAEVRAPENGRPRLEPSELAALTEREWASLQETSLALFSIRGQHQGRQVEIFFHSMPPVPDAGAVPPGIRMTAPSPERIALKYFSSAVPTGHTFSVSRDGLDAEVEHGVSALKLATELWTYAINEYLSPR